MAGRQLDNSTRRGFSLAELMLAVVQSTVAVGFEVAAMRVRVLEDLNGNLQRDTGERDVERATRAYPGSNTFQFALVVQDCQPQVSSLAPTNALTLPTVL